MLSIFKSRVKKLLRQSGSFIPQFSNNIIKNYSDPSAHIFFGYYDTSPFSYNDEIILACRIYLQSLQHNNDMDLGYYNLSDKNSKFIKFGKTKSWCWQMGSRLRWINKEHNYVAYNAFEKDNYFCNIQDPETSNIIEKHPLPFYDINKDASLGISLNFSRLQRLRPGYGYKNLPDLTEGISAPTDDGIILYNFKSKKQKILVSLSEISKIETDETMDDSEHYFNHISFSPFSNNFIFFHLWSTDKMRYRRLFLYNMQSKECRLLSSKLVSHYAWKSDNEILITEIHENNLRYALYDIRYKKPKIVGENILIEDGHPSFINDNKILIDTYPNLLGHQKLRVFDSVNQNIIKLGSFYSPSGFTGENKCDLHPRLSRNKEFVCFDTALSGKRGMFLLKIHKH